MSAPAPTDWFLLHAFIREVDSPTVWRQLFVPPTTTTRELHLLMQAAFGWGGGHLHMWSIYAVTGIEGYSPPIRTELNPEGFAVPNFSIGWKAVDNHPRPDIPGYYDNDLDPNDPEEAPHFAHFGPMRFTDDDDFGLPPDETIGELDARYDLVGHKHVLQYEYDMGDGWEHIVTVEKRRLPIAQVSAGKGHQVAEDVGGPTGWEQLKAAYSVMGTARDTPAFEAKRSWYEHSCENGDRKGLKGKQRLEAFSAVGANLLYKRFSREEEDAEEEEEYY